MNFWKDHDGYFNVEWSKNINDCASISAYNTLNSGFIYTKRAQYKVTYKYKFYVRKLMSNFVSKYVTYVSITKLH